MACAIYVLFGVAAVGDREDPDRLPRLVAQPAEQRVEIKPAAPLARPVGEDHDRLDRARGGGHRGHHHDDPQR